MKVETQQITLTNIGARMPITINYNCSLIHSNLELHFCFVGGIPYTREYVALQNKRDPADAIKVKDLDMGASPCIILVDPN